MARSRRVYHGRAGTPPQRDPLHPDSDAQPEEDDERLFDVTRLHSAFSGPGGGGGSCPPSSFGFSSRIWSLPESGTASR